VLAVLCWLSRQGLLRLIGPGLDAAHLVVAEQALSVLAWSLPAFILQAAWSVPLHADGRYLLSGFASLAYNLPAVACLAWLGRDCTETAVAWSFVGGAAFSALILLPGVRRMGLPWRELRWSGALMGQLGRQMAPLLGSALTGQGVALLERVVASYLGDGVITLLNLARKLANLPLVALTAVSQVLLGLMSRGQAADREPLLRQGLAASTLITTPAALGLLMSAPALVALLFPGVTGTERLAPLLGWYAVALVIAGWNALLARYCHAAGDTRLPFACDLAGSLAQAIAMPLLAWAFGLMGLAAATLIGVTVTGAMLLHHNGLWPRVDLVRLVLVSALPLAAGGLSLGSLPAEPALRLAVATAAGLLCLGLVAAVLRPWRQAAVR
jgi:polysaccharide biosynthesis protein PslK